jgi:hypothetical protein
MGQYGAMQILSLLFLEYHAINPCPAYLHNFLRVHDAAGKNNIFNKIKELGRIHDTCCLSPIALKGKETFTAKMKRKIDSAAGCALKKGIINQQSPCERDTYCHFQKKNSAIQVCPLFSI